MAETKGNRNAQELKTSGGFRISRKPLVHITAAEERQDSPDTIGLPRKHGARILFAIARDPRTIFASWNIDWPALFEKVVPVDRQVHLRLPRIGLRSDITSRQTCGIRLRCRMRS